MHPYTPFAADPALLTPGLFEDTRFFFFFLQADRENTQALCDRYLNDRAADAGVHYRAFGMVMLAFTHVERLRSPSSPEFITYKDIALWLPVYGGSARTGKHLCLFPPFIFVDDASTMATGREVFGLPKQMGRFTMPLCLEDLSTASAPQFTADVMSGTRPDEARSMHRLLDIRRLSSLSSPWPAVPSDGDDPLAHLMGKAAAKLASVGLGGIDVPAGLGTMRALGLKQFRDVANPERACHQAIVEAPLSPVKVHRVRPLFGGFELTLHDLASHPVADQLGLKNGPQEVWFTIYLQATMRMEAGQEIWRSDGHER